jgi:Holliday junction DNA helicase RuvB
MEKEQRIFNAQRKDEDLLSLRPGSLSELIGQEELKANLNVFISAALKEVRALDHILFHGPPGLGKTTLSHIVSRELGVGFRATSAPMISKAGDLAAILTNLQQNDVLFIDEIHRLNPAIEEVLYSAMEDFQLDLIIGEGPAARSVRIDLQPFTLIGATTKTGLLTSPLRERFGIPMRLKFYNDTELKKIVERSAKLLNIKIDEDAALKVAQSSRGTPRIANRLLKRIKDFALYNNADTIDYALTVESLKKLGVDEIGLDDMDTRYLRYIINHYNGGPVGVENICAGLSEELSTIEDVVEPYLLQQGFIQRTPRGRVVTETTYLHLKIKKEI